LHALNKEFVTFADLQTTLAAAGVRSGSCLIKLNFKKTNQPLEEAMAEIGQYFKNEEEAESGPTNSEGAPTSEGPPPITGAIQRTDSTEEDTEMKDVASVVTPTKPPAPATPEAVILGPNQRPISVYAAPSSDVPKAALQPHNEDDYEPTIAHAKLHQSRLQNRSQNQRLLGDAELELLEKEKAAKLATVKKVDIKLRFPDQTTMVVPFTADDTAAFLYDFVTKAIAAENQPFKLVWNDRGPNTVPKDEKNSKKKLIKDLGLEGKVVVNLVWEDGASDSARKAPTLKEEYAKMAQQVAVPEVTEVEAKEETITPTLDKGKSKEDPEGGSSKGKGIPKWLKGLPKK
jgi:tether containing UBX domain for GLUT4